MTATSPELNCIAVHEAGHAVAGVLLKRRFKYVTIVPDEDSLGHCAFPSESARLEKLSFGECTARDLSRLRLCILTGLAGSAAEDRAFGRHQLMDEQDGEAVIDVALRLTSGSDNVGQLVESAWSEVRKLWDNPHNWAAVQAVASALLDRRRLAYGRVRGLVARQDMQQRVQQPTRPDATVTGRK